MLLEFSEALERRPVNPDDLPQHTEPKAELRRVTRRRGRRHLANFDHLPVTTHIYELDTEQRACPGCGAQRKEAGAEESWQIEYLPGRFERIQHVRKKYACPGCESSGEHPQMETAAKPESAIDKGLAGPGLLSYIVTSKFNDYLPLYRLEDIFARQGFEISRATQSVWCGDVADLVEPLYELMAKRVRASHVVATDDTILPMLNTGKTANARMWGYVGDDAHPYNLFHFTLDRGRDGPMGSFPGMPVIMDRAYEGNETRQLLLALDMVPVVPPKSNRVDAWSYDRALYRKRNEIDRLFRRLKGFRRIFSRFDKLDCIFLAFVSFALIVEALR
jgi:transposase